MGKEKRDRVMEDGLKALAGHASKLKQSIEAIRFQRCSEANFQLQAMRQGVPFGGRR
jgi:hypothetical protein